MTIAVDLGRKATKTNKFSEANMDLNEGILYSAGISFCQ